MQRRKWLAAWLLAGAAGAGVVAGLGRPGPSGGAEPPAKEVDKPPAKADAPSAAYDWLSVLLETCAREVERDGARPTILSRTMAIAMTAMYDAWAAYDDKAVGTRLGGKLRRPPAERTRANKEKAIGYAVYPRVDGPLPGGRQMGDGTGAEARRRSRRRLDGPVHAAGRGQRRRGRRDRLPSSRRRQPTRRRGRLRRHALLGLHLLPTR